MSITMITASRNAKKVLISCACLAVLFTSHCHGLPADALERNPGRLLRGCRNNNYRCPEYSTRKENRDCYDTFDDCECHRGYYKKDGKCEKEYKTGTKRSSSSADRKDEKCDYKCPSFSQRKPGRDCYNNFDDCKCYDGYHKFNGRCEEQTTSDTRRSSDSDDNREKCNYSCPSNSRRRPGRDCYNNFDDCECFHGYYKRHGRCEKKSSTLTKSSSDSESKHDICNYTCPTYSKRKASRDCYNNFDDCECFTGYYKKGGQCKKKSQTVSKKSSESHDENRKCNYKCPLYSQRKPGRRCYNDFDDCECFNGYYKKFGKCHKESSSFSKRSSDNSKDRKDCTYKCPINSYRKPGRNCYNNFDDCECYAGYYKNDGHCMKDTSLESKSKISTTFSSSTGKSDVSTKSRVRSTDSKSSSTFPKTSSSGTTKSTRSKDKGSKCDYRCPANSHRKPLRACYDSFNDCECNNGYYKENKRCVKA